MRIAFHDLDIIAGSAWEQARGYLREELERLQVAINTTWSVAHAVDGTQLAASQGQILGQLTGTLAEQPTGLSADDDALLYFVTDFHQLVRWDGSTSAWKFAPGHGNGYFRDFGITPQEAGWALCDGSATTYLVVGGASLTTASFTTPNLTGGTFRKGGTYTGSTVGAVAPGVSIGGGIDAESSHTHPFLTGARTSALTDITVAVGGGVATGPVHIHDGTTNAGSSHSHGIGSLTATADTAARPPSLAAPVYFKR